MAQTYTRQSSFSDGDTITASLFNDEYNQLVNAFSYSSSSASSTGHRHDGNAGQGGNIPQIGDLDFLNKIVVDSTNNRWGFYVEVSSSAVEQVRIQDGAIVPVTDNDIDLGTSSLEFKDLFLDGTAHIDTLDVDVNATVAGTLGVTGATTLSSTLAVTGAVTGSSTIQGTTITATTAFVPDASDGAALGTSSLEFSDLFLADGAVINLGADQDTTLTHVADTGILLNSTRQLQFGDSGTYIHQSADGVLDLVSDTEIEINATTIDINGAVDISGNLDVGGNLVVTGTTTFNGGTLTMGDAATDNVVFGADVNSNIIPNTDNTYDLGSSSQEWKDLYIDGTAYLDAINFNGTAITATAAELNIMDGVTATASELNILDGVTSTASELNILDGVTSTTAELNYNDTGAAVGTVVASKVVTVDANKDASSFRNVTLTGELAAGSLDISGDIDVDGTTNLDVVDIDGAVDMASTLTVADDLAVDTDTLFVDASTDRVGIGTTSPSNPLHIKDSSPTIRLEDSDGTGGQGIAQIQNTANGNLRLIADPNDDGASTSSIEFEIDGAEIARFRGTGRLGINTSSPSYELDVQAASDPSIRVMSTGTGSSDDALVRVQIGGTSASSYLYFGDSDDADVGNIRYAHSNNHMIFTTAASEAMRIDSSGQVGIGTSSPANKLTVSESSADFAALIQNSLTSGNGLKIQAGDNSGDRILQLDDKDGNEKLRVTALGNVGIGTASPSYALDVAGSINVTDTSGALAATFTTPLDYVAKFESTDASGYIILEDSDSTNNANRIGAVGDSLRIVTNSTEAMHITSAQDIGIGGTPAAGYRLDVIDSGATLARIRSLADSDVSQYFYSAGTTATQNIFFGDTGNTAAGGIRYYHSDDKLTFIGKGAGNEMARFDSSGQFTILGDTATFDTTPTLGLNLYYETDSGFGTIGTYSSGGTTALTFHTNSSGGATSEKMRIAGDGKVGIGTTAPAYELDVDSTIHIGNDGGSGYTHSRLIFDANGAGRGIGSFYHNQVNDVEWFAGNAYNDSDSFAICRKSTASHSDSTADNANSLMSIDGDGNVLIGGTATPTSSAGNIVLRNGTAPTGNAANGIILYAEDVSSSSELKVRDEAGNVTTLSPHNFELIPEGPSEEMAWSYFSERDGKRINVDMLKALRVLEKLSGEQLVFES